ncbi:antibiotic biosynthesis monooxygenase family protein [Nocardia abscessus]|jgi:quinol monooxygenase YgiN|uniref:antibiotic biosynthesis monooxygenase family protein n=1 Tax=Nocardia abscessus TaxID=120957 RepID=UPI002455CF7E|nr:antibiotic biosynthesis monooxygenase [Nocardia abscessus]
MTNPADLAPAATDQSVTFLNIFSVPAPQKDRFLSHWKGTARCMMAAPGFVRVRMLQVLTDPAELTFVMVGEWESGTALDVARTNADWQQAIRQMNEDPELDLSARPMVCTTTLDAGPADVLD